MRCSSGEVFFVFLEDCSQTLLSSSWVFFGSRVIGAVRLVGVESDVGFSTGSDEMPLLPGSFSNHARESGPAKILFQTRMPTGQQAEESAALAEQTGEPGLLPWAQIGRAHV